MDYWVAYWEQPHQVVWIDIYLPTGVVTLKGMDNYWVEGNRYGMFNDPENAEWYEGPQAIAWEVGEDGRPHRIEDTDPPAGATILQGFMLTDDQARYVGLID